MIRQRKPGEPRCGDHQDVFGLPVPFLCGRVDGHGGAHCAFGLGGVIVRKWRRARAA